MVVLSASATDADDVLIDLNEGHTIDGHDELIALVGDSNLNGGEGNDALTAVRGCNVLDGGGGSDTTIYFS